MLKNAKEMIETRKKMIEEINRLIVIKTEQRNELETEIKTLEKKRSNLQQEIILMLENKV